MRTALPIVFGENTFIIVKKGEKTFILVKREKRTFVPVKEGDAGWPRRLRLVVEGRPQFPWLL